MKPSDVASRAVLSVSPEDRDAIIEQLEELKELVRVRELAVLTKPEFRSGELSATIE
jgi:hypothetical protein